MSRVDYRAIGLKLKQVIEADQDLLYGIPVTLEEEFPFGQIENGWIGVYMTGRGIREGQPLAIGRSMRMSVYFSVWCFGYNIGEQGGAFVQRDDLIGKVEEILMKNRDLTNEAEIVEVTGGQFINARDEEEYFVAAGSVDIVVDVQARV